MKLLNLDTMNAAIDLYNRKTILPEAKVFGVTIASLKQDGFIDTSFFDSVTADEVFDDELYHSVLDFREYLPHETVKKWDTSARENMADGSDLAVMARFATQDALRDYMCDRFKIQFIDAPQEISVRITAMVVTTITLGFNETVEQATNRTIDIYLHGKDDEWANSEKEDLGADEYNIEVID